MKLEKQINNNMKKEDLMNQFCDTIQLKKYSAGTLKIYKYHLGLFWCFKSNIFPYNLSSYDIRDYLLYLNSKTVSDSYFNQALNSIIFFFKYVLNKKIKDYLVMRPKKAKTQPILLSDSEIQAIFTNCNNLKHLSILSLLYSAGLRVSEIINLKIKDIDSKRMVIYIIQSKGRKSRMVKLDENVLKLLRQYYLQYYPKEFLFNGQFSLQYSKRSIEQFVKDLAFKSGIDKRVYPHLFRHCQITGLVDNGTDIFVIKEHSGHQKISTTSGYIQLSAKRISQIESPINNIKLPCYATNHLIPART